MIELQNLVKDYGSLRAVDNINFQINDGEILGFLGPNGAGKSTTLKMITCYLTPTEGNIQIGDFNVFEHSKEIRKLIGYLPEHNPLYLEMTVYDYLRFVAAVREVKPEDFKEVLTKVIEKCSLSTVIARPIKELSKGFRQRVGIAQAIIHDPKILILDEPTSGLDPNQIYGIRTLIKELGKEKTIIFSSHTLHEVQATCDRIVIIDKGKIVDFGTLAQLREKHQKHTKLYCEIKFDNSKVENEIQETLSSMISSIPKAEITVTDIKNGICRFEITYPKNKDYREEIYNFIKTNGWVALEMQTLETSLEDIFRSLTVGGKNE